MSRHLVKHSVASAFQRLNHLVKNVGIVGTFSSLWWSVDDVYFRTFDRRYRVKTSGFLRLAETGFDQSRLRDATQYGPANGWGFRKMLKQLKLSKQLSFVDFGCGLGRACFLAAEYGFAKVSGVELAPELCAGARQNISTVRLESGRASEIQILHMDVLKYLEITTDDVFFMFRPFSREFTGVVLNKLVERARTLKKPFVIIYSERMAPNDCYAPEFKSHKALREISTINSHGQTFYIFECAGK